MFLFFPLNTFHTLSPSASFILCASVTPDSHKHNFTTDTTICYGVFLKHRLTWCVISLFLEMFSASVKLFWKERIILHKTSLVFLLSFWRLSSKFTVANLVANYRSQWPRGLSRMSAAARLLRSWVRIPPGAWIFVCCECCVLSGRGLCDELIARPEESYRMWCVLVCDLETSWMRRPWPNGGCCAKNKQINLVANFSTYALVWRK